MTEQKSQSKAGGLFLTGIGFAVILVGAVFVWLLWSSYSQVQEMKSWTETPCEVTVSDYNMKSAEFISEEFSWNLGYKYTVGGEVYTSKRYRSRGGKWTSALDRIDAMIEQYPVGMKTVCYVNPQNPKVAILKFDSQASLYIIWFPMLFVVGGIGIMWGAVKGMKLIPC